MTDDRALPPLPEGCLTSSRASRYHGGTLIADDVHDLDAHRQRLADPDGYRPRCCPRCGGGVLHVHDYPRRKPRGGSGMPAEIAVVRYICAAEACAATWRVLPAFLARHLWRAWPTVERARTGARPRTLGRAPVPEQTQRRWRARLSSSAAQIVLLLARHGGAPLGEIAERAGQRSTRAELIDVHARLTGAPPDRRLADVAVLVHRLERGVRLM